MALVGTVKGVDAERRRHDGRAAVIGLYADWYWVLAEMAEWWSRFRAGWTAWHPRSVNRRMIRPGV